MTRMHDSYVSCRAWTQAIFVTCAPILLSDIQFAPHNSRDTDENDSDLRSRGPIWRSCKQLLFFHSGTSSALPVFSARAAAAASCMLKSGGCCIMMPVACDRH
ncbi:hypothetical protein E4T56_gene6090, partial [Termitomyces sp. T112]